MNAYYHMENLWLVAICEFHHRTAEQMRVASLMSMVCALATSDTGRPGSQFRAVTLNTLFSDSEHLRGMESTDAGLPESSIVSIPPQTHLSDRYVITKQLAKTNHSVVYHAIQDGATSVVIKCMTRAQAREEEAAFLKELAHPLIVPLLDDFWIGQTRCLVFPHARGGTLHSLPRAAVAEEALQNYYPANGVRRCVPPLKGNHP